MGLISHVIQTGTSSKKATDKFMLEIYESKFMFDNDVYEYLNSILKKAKELRYKDQKIDGHCSREEKEKLLNEKDAIFDWFVDQMKESQTLFSKYFKK